MLQCAVVWFWWLCFWQWNIVVTNSWFHRHGRFCYGVNSFFVLRVGLTDKTHGTRGLDVSFWLSGTATHCNTLPHTATHCNTATHCYTQLHTLTHWRNARHKRPRCLSLTVRYCNTLQHTATHCNTLQHTATHCNTLQHTCLPIRHPYMIWFVHMFILYLLQKTGGRAGDI